MTKKVRLGDISAVITKGTTPTTVGYDFVDEGINFVKIESITESGNFLIERFAHITSECDKKLSRSQLQKNDLLFSIAGAIGRTAIVTEDILPANTNQALAIIRVPEGVADYSYLKYALQSPAIVEQFEKRKQGVAQLNISLKDIGEFEIPICNTEEQRTIVNVMDKVSALISQRKQQLAKLDELVKARFAEMFGDPVSNPKRLEIVPLGKRCEIVTGNTPSRAEPENYGDYIEWIKSENINTPFTFITKAQEYLSETGFKKCRFVEAGSLLMTCIAGSVNCIGNVAVTNRRVAFNQQINAIVPKQDEVLYLYWLMLLSKPVIHNTINMALKGILNKGQLAELTFPFPPIALQEQFAAFVAQIDKSKFDVQQSFDKLEIFKKALMQKYFV